MHNLSLSHDRGSDDRHHDGGGDDRHHGGGGDDHQNHVDEKLVGVALPASVIPACWAASSAPQWAIATNITINISILTVTTTMVIMMTTSTVHNYRMQYNMLLYAG